MKYKLDKYTNINIKTYISYLKENIREQEDKDNFIAVIEYSNEYKGAMNILKLLGFEEID